MSTTLTPQIDYIRNGEAVDAGITNRPIRQVASRIQRIRDRLDASEPGTTIILPDVAITSDVRTGMPVYFNSTTSKFSPGLATNNINGLQPADSAVIWGLARVIEGTLTADIILEGALEISLTQAGVSSPAAGEYYLSGSTAGRLQTSPAAIPIRVCSVGPDGLVYVCPSPVGPPDGHFHYRFNLDPTPAGTIVLSDEALSPTTPTVTIISADSSLTGWLPADDPIFNDEAPDGAYFGYNISQDPQLLAAWPPDPIDAASFVVFEEANGWYGREVRPGANGLVQFTRSGIWWMTNYADDAPWNYPDDSIAVIAGLLEEQRPDRYTTLFFGRSRYGMYRTAVTSLRSVNAAITVVSDCDGSAASAGPLVIDWNPDYESTTTTDLGGLAIKEFNAGSFVKGPVISGLTPLDDTVTLSGGSTMADPNRPGKTLHYGSLAIQFNDSPRELTIPAQIIKLSGGQQRFESDLLAIGIAASTGIKLKFKLPGASRFPANSLARLRLWVSGNDDANLPALTVTRRRIPRVTVTPATIPTSSTAVAITMPGPVEDGEYIEIESAAWTVAADDLIYMEVSRGADDYDGEVEIIDAHLRIYDSTA